MIDFAGSYSRTRPLKDIIGIKIVDRIGAMVYPWLQNWQRVLKDMAELEEKS